MLVSGRVARMRSIHTTDHQLTKTLVQGTQSKYEVTYRGNPPEEARKAFEYALKIWADVFPCTIELRILVAWERTPRSRTLASTVSLFSVVKSKQDNSALRSDAAYTPTLAAAVGNKDYAGGNFHIEMTFNSAQPWHLATNTSVPESSFDFVTVALHQVGHGLFFTGALLANPSIEEASFQSMDNLPGRFDHFIQMSNGLGIARSCNESGMYRALTTPGLMFKTTSPENTFTLHAPEGYRRGSSTYFFDPSWLEKDCARQNISKADCSMLMTHELDPGETRRSIGVPTRRIMRTVLGISRGLPKSTCAIPAPLILKEEEEESFVYATSRQYPPIGAILPGCIAAIAFAVAIILSIKYKICARSATAAGKAQPVS